ncbi:MAG: 16S rRNA (cytosine(1402)-N(4))-methyltransferase RsmH [Desulfamplus sp.]|nr:16S rRNA (cytosine(1402)-N(4))-methyltransferase RsmH [Desulfamplus sp.]MBF0258475.1 16S rRNA (cytosine(1402)-N(4))-methyltransferase RsmH [Desulfamplus sp.]
MTFTHISVLPSEACFHLNLKPGAICVDGTLGGCGHALTILKKILPDGRLIAIDQDMDAVKNAENLLVAFSNNVNIFHDNFSSLPAILESLGIIAVDAILVDLGLSFHQLMESQRGFSFQKDEPLDMRMDRTNSTTAADIINGYSEKSLADIFFRYGEERMSRKIARTIVEKRKLSPIVSTGNLASLVRQVMPAKLLKTQKIHPATRVFQALRIEVNRELDHLETFMSHVPEMLNVGGRLCVISFHSLEDRIVKQSIRSFEKGCTCPREFPQCSCGFVPTLKSIFRKPIIPGEEEICKNPLARSAKMRVAEKISTKRSWPDSATPEYEKKICFHSKKQSVLW